MSKILDVKIDCAAGPPCLVKVLLEPIPKTSSMVFEERENIYLAIDEDYATIFYFEKPGRGHSTWIFDANMADGSTRRIIGPWLSNDIFANAVFPESKIARVITTDNTSLWEKDRFLHEGYVLLDSLVRHLKDRGIVCGMVRNHWGEEEFSIIQDPQEVGPNEIYRF